MLLLMLAPTIGLLLLVVCLLLSSKSRRTHSDTRRVEAIELAGRHVESGNLDIAAQLLADAARSDDAIGEYAQAARAIIYLRQRQPGQAVWLLSNLIEEPRRRCNVVVNTLEHALAYAHAVGGSLGLAERQCLAAILLRHANSPLRYVLLCKRRRFSEVAAMSVRPKVRERLLPAGTALADAQLGWHGERVVALLGAFALCQSAVPESPAAWLRIGEFLTAARPTYSGEYDYLQANWPELRAFLEEHADRLGARTSVRLSPELPQAATFVRKH